MDPAPLDDLDRPLGIDAPRGRPEGARLPYFGLALAGAGLIAGSLGVFAYLRPDHRGRELPPTAPVAASVPAKPEATPAAPTVAPSDTTASIAPKKRVVSAEEVEEASGVKVVRPGGAAVPGALIIEVPQPSVVQLPPAPDPRLIETSARGGLPRIGPDGSRPSEIYARPLVFPPGLGPSAPRVAVVLGGVGLGRSTTDEAIAKLPAEVTLALAPSGVDPANDAARARADGHEIMLQVPMEPLDYPKQDPGPYALLSSVKAADNLRRLHWLMSRFPGYVGVINFLGGRFTADPAALVPVLRDIAARGLIYADDGTSPRSPVPGLAAQAGVSVVETNVVIDAAASGPEIDAALAQLESLAKRKGLAVGSATALPLTLDHLARWSAGLAGRGVALVPVSAAARRPADAVAQER